ncbi:MAG: SDR family oxidoreductase [Fusobacterium sp.]|uniref:SDR family NAD(P)-dependent oxidoreductase n=1 Tax=Fusobacterium sp. TaxID=68766 RepID=UPI0026DB9927|nr:SDR family oxidoreductase [Fusobacterium sp.]MDO4689752.1 SDR family oxidoreductase [Fusobacterium sp.]
MSVVLITGASSGIGKELAYFFAKRNYNLILLARNTQKLLEIKDSIEKKFNIACKIISYDLKNTENLEKIVEENNFDILINCAAFGEMTNFDNLTLEKDIEMLNVNLISPIILTKLFLKKALERDEGTVMNICSTAALYYHPYMTMYSTTKAGLLNYSLSLSEEIRFRTKNVHLLSICPGPTATPFFEEETKAKFGVFKVWEMSAESVAKDILRVFDKKKRFAIIGLRNKILAKFTAMLPISLQLKVVARHLRKGAK